MEITRRIAIEFSNAFTPVVNNFRSVEEFNNFLQSLGWDVSSLTGIPNNFQIILGNAETLFTIVSDIVENGNIEDSDLQEIFTAIKEIVDSILDLENGVGLPTSLTDAGFHLIFPRQLIDYLINTYLFRHQPMTANFLGLVGIIKTEYHAETADRPSYYSRSINFEQIPDIFEDPFVTFEDEFNWGEPDFDSDKLFHYIENIFSGFGIDIYVSKETEEATALIVEGNTSNSYLGIKSLNFPFYYKKIASGIASSGFKLGRIPAYNTLMPGLILIPYLEANSSIETPLYDTLWLVVSGSMDFSGGMAIILRPGESLEIVKGFLNGQISQQVGDLKFKIEDRTTDPAPKSLLSFGDIGGLYYSKLSLLGGFELDTSGVGEMYFEVDLIDAFLEINPSNSDGFLSKVIPGDGIKVDFDLTAGFSTEKGFYFSGSSGLEILLPTNISRGSLTINNLKLKLAPGNGNLLFTSSANVGLDIGPIFCQINDIGLKLALDFPSSKDGNMGILDLNAAFKFPSSLALSINSKGFSGGGSLSIGDNRYVGTLVLRIGKINLTAIAIINTKLPNGKEGFSLLIIITVDGFKPIDLGAGFTLNGVGGLLGLNRTVMEEVILDGLKTGINESILFPTDVVNRAEFIIKDLESVFPVAEDRFVFGPMAKLAWGNGKNIITADIGLFIEVPNPVTVILLGVLRAIIGKDESKAILDIKASFAGIFAQETKSISFDASIFDSRLMAFTLEGDLAIRIVWGDNPNFVFSAGGFHPAYQPPPLRLDNMKRLTITLLDERKAKVFIESYFAVTSNSVQVGAYAEAKFRVLKYDILGFLGFDVLFQFNPFMFKFDAQAGFAVMKNGKEKMSIAVSFSLAGPAPWKVKGRATAKILGIKLKLRFNKTFGKEETLVLPNVNVEPLFVAELDKEENWYAIPPANTNDLVKIRKISGANGLVIDPFGAFVIGQKIVPLKKRIQKFGNQNPSGANWFTIAKVKIGSISFEALNDEQEFFAPAHFEALEDHQKLSSPSFKKYNSGVKVPGTDAPAHGNATKRDIQYETILIDGEDAAPPGYSNVNTLWMDKLRIDSAAGKSSLSFNKKVTSKITDRKIHLREEVYRIINIEDLTPFNTQKYTEAEAEAALEDIFLVDPALIDTLEIVPEYEMDGAQMVVITSGGGSSI